MDWPNTWKELEAMFGVWDEERFDTYDVEAQKEAVAKLSNAELVEALSDVVGCGCCVSGGAANLRYEVMRRIRDIVKGA